ncbi:MAG: hypothetical protein JW829_13910, partial [Pirellulales bacterium]|nr:hypothetical protein [Pirellulales bacterium]
QATDETRPDAGASQDTPAPPEIKDDGVPTQRTPIHEQPKPGPAEEGDTTTSLSGPQLHTASYHPSTKPRHDGWYSVTRTR